VRLRWSASSKLSPRPTKSQSQFLGDDGRPQVVDYRRKKTGLGRHHRRDDARHGPRPVQELTKQYEGETGRDDRAHKEGIMQNLISLLIRPPARAYLSPGGRGASLWQIQSMAIRPFHFCGKRGIPPPKWTNKRKTRNQQAASPRRVNPF